MVKNNQSQSVPFWNDPKNRSLVFQAVSFILVLLVGYFLYSNTQANLQKQNIASGFGFLSLEAGFEIGESVIDYASDNTYHLALWAGVINTLKVALIGNILAIILGSLIGILRLSKNWLLAKASYIYIESFRNIPLLLQLFFWYALFTEIFPSVKKALNPLSGIYLSNRGLNIPFPSPNPIHKYMLIGLLFSLIASYVLDIWAKKRQDDSGKPFPVLWTSFGLVLGIPFIIWLFGGAPTALSFPELKGFNFSGGYTISPEFASLLLGLVLYTSAFIAEIVRAGIVSVSKGQREAAQALGLRPRLVLSLVILPQALRVIIPPLTSQLLNLTKNSSLAVAIAYPDFVSVANTTMNQTGQAIELIGLILVVYLTFSLLTSLFMNWYNKKIALVER